MIASLSTTAIYMVIYMATIYPNCPTHGRCVFLQSDSYGKLVADIVFTAAAGNILLVVLALLREERQQGNELQKARDRIAELEVQVEDLVRSQTEQALEKELTAKSSGRDVSTPRAELDRKG